MRNRGGDSGAWRGVPGGGCFELRHLESAVHHRTVDDSRGQQTKDSRLRYQSPMSSRKAADTYHLPLTRCKLDADYVASLFKQMGRLRQHREASDVMRCDVM